MARSAILTWLLPLVACLTAAGAVVYAVAVLSYPAAVPLPVAYAVAALVASTAAVGRTLPGRMALGVVLVAAPIAFAGALFAVDGRDLLGLALGGVLLLCAMPMLLLGDLVPGPRPPTDYAPVAASGCAALLVAAGLVSDPRHLPVLAIGGVYLVLAALVAATPGASGPVRFATGVLWAALSATGVYFLAISSAGPVLIALGALVTSACVVAIGPLRDVLSAEPSDAERRVR